MPNRIRKINAKQTFHEKACAGKETVSRSAAFASSPLASGQICH
jgi:hypothetical protein